MGRGLDELERSERRWKRRGLFVRRRRRSAWLLAGLVAIGSLALLVKAEGVMPF